MPEEKEESIDLGRLSHIIWEKKKITGGIVVGCTLLALLVSLILPKKWESTVVVQTRNAAPVAASDMAAAMGLQAKADPTLNYIELMKTRTVLDPIIEQMDWGGKKPPKAAAFAKSWLDIKNTKQTNLITIAAKGRTPEEAQTIAQSVADNFLSMQTDKNQQTQSLLVQFLNGRIADAKQEAEDASQKFADYQREHKMYSPDEEAKATVEKLKGYDDAIKDVKVAQATTQAKLEVVNGKLSEIAGESKAYNINDNANVQSIRGQIISAEVELAGLREHYTENHPTIIAARQRLSELQQALQNEVDTVVDSNTTSLNPVQADLMKAQAEGEAGLAASQASEQALVERRAEVEDHLSSFPQTVIEYLQLQREATLKNDIYLGLVKQCEQNKIDEAKESMDIQIIDSADLPDEDAPVAPRKKLITAIGFVLGCMISFGYSLVMYKREA